MGQAQADITALQGTVANHETRIDDLEAGSSVMVDSAHIVDGTIVNADVNASAGILTSKLSGIARYIDTRPRPRGSRYSERGKHHSDYEWYPSSTSMWI